MRAGGRRARPLRGRARPRPAVRVAQDLRHAEVEELPGLGEDTRGLLGQVPDLVPVHGQHTGQGQEEGDAQAGQRVQVHIEAPAPARGDEPRVGDRLAAARVGVFGGLEVEQHHRGLVLGDHDVEQVQVVEDDAARVHRLDGLLHQAVQAHRPPAVLPQLLRCGVGLDQGVAVGEEGVQRLALDVLHHQEVVVAEGEGVLDLGGAGQSGEALQGGALLFQAAYRVGAVGGQAGVRPGLLEHHGLTGAPVPPRVDASAVGEVQGALDVVRQTGDVDGAARLQARTEEVGGGHPPRRVEDRAAPVGHEYAVGVLQRGHRLAVLVVAVPSGEAPVAQVGRARVPAYVAEDVRAGFAAHECVQTGGDRGALVVVGRVDGDELPAGPAIGVLGVPVVQQVPGGDELEGDAPFHAVVPDPGQDRFRVVQAGGDVDLPSLVRQVVLDGAQCQPVAGAVALPSFGHRTLGRLEDPVAFAGRPGGAGARPETVGRVVEVAVGVAEHTVPLDHTNSLTVVPVSGIPDSGIGVISGFIPLHVFFRAPCLLDINLWEFGWVPFSAFSVCIQRSCQRIQWECAILRLARDPLRRFPCRMISMSGVR
ncbi:hypothetical protein A6A08_17075 [Nocardiopsis sp. TSRI0078]|nr:hypothetical protein A6A08_17075 [Nocardiopsis sp. TSRI0078]